MKKVLALVLTFALVLTSFSMAFADDATTAPTPAGKAGKALSDIAASPNKEAIGVVNDLGIVVGTPEGTFLPTKEVTRAEFAVMLTKALAIPNSALEGYSQTPFKDMAGYEWSTGYLAFCLSKGIMVGDGYGNAMPGRTVSLNEAVTMALRAIGYVDNSSELKGAWPANYVTKAQELDLYKDVAKDMVGATRENAAQIIYNLLPIQKVAVDTDGKTNPLWDVLPRGTNPGVETTLFSAGLNCKAEPLAVISAEDLGNSSINLAKHIGEFGTKYVSKTTKKAVAFISADNTAKLVGRFIKDGKEFVTTDTEVTYTVKENTKYEGADVKVEYLENGKSKETKDQVKLLTNFDVSATVTAADAVVAKSTAQPGKEVSIFVELSGKTIKNTFSVNKWETSGAEKVTASDLSDIKDKKLLSKKFAKNDNNDLDLNQFELVGVKSLEDIKADNIVYVYFDGDAIRKVEVGTQTVEGVVKNFKNAAEADGLAPNFKVGDKVYKNAKEVINFVGPDVTLVNADDVAAEVKLLLDGRGFVYDKTSTTKANKFAVVERVSLPGGLSDQVKLLLADGTEKVFDYAGKTTDSTKQVDAKAYVKGTVIGYGLDKDGKIASANHNYLDTATTTVNFRSNTLVKYQEGGNDKFATIDKDVVVFTYDGEPAAVGARKDFEVSSIDKVKKADDTTQVVLLFEQGKKISDTNKRDKVVAILLASKFAKSGEKKYAAINEINFVTNADGKRVQEVKGVKDGAAFTALTSSDDVFTTSAVKYTFSDNMVGKDADVAVYEIRVDSKGVITEATAVPATANADKTADNATLGGLAKTVHSVAFVVAKDADGRNSVVVNDVATTAFTAPLSAKANIYKLTSDGYEVFNGTLKKGDIVKLYELDEEVGYDVVIFVRN